MGQSNIWYADEPRHNHLKARVLQYLKSRKLAAHGASAPKKNLRSIRAWQQDQAKRRKVEEAAMKATEAYYADRGYSTKRVHLEMLGWDIEARRGGEQLKVEVKGLSGNDLAVELTPNEFKQMNRNKGSYHLSVVLNALKKPCTPRVFAFRPETAEWRDEQGSLKCKEVVAAIFVG